MSGASGGADERLAPVGVTTTSGPDDAQLMRARDLARRIGAPFVPRGKHSVAEVMRGVARAVLVIEADAVALHDAEGAVTWSPGMAHLRIKTLDAGGNDTLVEVAELRSGDRVLDCTMGFGQDALVAARAVGPSGRVVAVEKSPALFALTSEGLRAHPVPANACPVEPVFADAAELLLEQPEGSFDVVLFDPMFARPRKAQTAFEVLRRVAEYAPLTREMIEAARRVARRAVIIKASRYSDDLKKLGVAPLQRSRYADVVWGRVPSVGRWP